MAFSDSQFNQWVLLAQQAEDGDSVLSIFGTLGATVTTIQTFTSTSASGGNNFSVLAFSGGASAPDQIATSQGYSANPFTVGPITPTNPNAIVLTSACADGTSFSSVTNVAGNTITLVDSQAGGSGQYALADAYQLQTTATRTIAGWNQNNPQFTYGIATAILNIFSAQSPATLLENDTTLAEGFVLVAYTNNPNTNVSTNLPLNITGGVEPYTCTIGSGTLPTGLTINSGNRCSITGTPTGADTASIVVHVVDAVGTSADSTTLSLTIASTALSISTSSLPSGTQYGTYSSSITGTGGTGTLSYAATAPNPYSIYAALTLPEGIAINSSSGALTSSLIGGAGIYPSIFTVTDSLGTYFSKTINISITGSYSWIPGIWPASDISQQSIVSLPVDTSPAAPINAAYINSSLQIFFGTPGGGGIPAIEIPNATSAVAVSNWIYQGYFGTCVHGSTCYGTDAPTAPIPLYTPVEDTAIQVSNPPTGSAGDGHFSVYQESSGSNHAMLWEGWQTSLQSGTGPGWNTASNAVWDVASGAMIEEGTTDAAGLRLLPYLETPDEIIGTGTVSVPNGVPTHAIRFTQVNGLHYWVWDGTETPGCCGSCYDLSGHLIPTGTQLTQGSSQVGSCNFTGPFGQRYRIKSTYTNPACVASNPWTAIIVQQLRDYGMILADKGRSFGLIGVPDPRWPTELTQSSACINQITGAAFEPVNVSSLNTNGPTSFLTSGSGGTAPTSFTSGCPTTTATQGVPYSFTLVANGSPTPTYSILSGNPPSGLTLNSATGVLVGTPIGGGTSTFSPQATNSAGAYSQSCSITVTPVSPSVPSGISAAGVIAKFLHRIPGLHLP